MIDPSQIDGLAERAIDLSRSRSPNPKDWVEMLQDHGIQMSDFYPLVEPGGHAFILGIPKSLFGRTDEGHFEIRIPSHFMEQMESVGYR